MRKMDLLYLTLAAGLWMLTYVECGRPRRRRLRSCTPENNKFYLPKIKKCRRCQPCGPGWGLDPDPKDIIADPNSHLPLTCYKCHPCKPGSYSNAKDYNRCLTCTNCSSLARLEDKRCDGTSNAICGNCQPMYHDVYAKMYMYDKVDPTKACQHCEHAKDTSIPECEEFLTKITPHPSPKTVPLRVTLTLPRGTSGDSRTIVPKAEPEAEKHNELDVPSELTGASATAAHPAFFFVIVSIMAFVSVVFVVGVVAWLRGKRNSTSRAVNYRPGVTEDRPICAGGDSQIEEDGGGAGTRVSRSVVRVDGVQEVEQRLLSQDNTLVDLNGRLTLPQKVLLRRVGRAWPDLARVLGLSDADIDYLRHENWESQDERIHQMIVTWERRYPTQSSLGNTILALRRLNKHSLAKLLTEQCNRER